MAFDYADAARTAQELIAEFGQSAFLRQSGAASGDAWNPTFAGDVDTAVTVVRLKNTRERLAAEGALERVFISTAGLDEIAPGTKDRIVIGDEVFEIMLIRPLSPGGIVVYWEAEVEKG